MLGGGIESLPDGASVVHIGDGLSFVMPWREFRPTPSQSARIEMAACMGMLGLAMDDGQLTAERRRLLSEVEAEMAKEARRRAKIPEGRALHVPRHLYADEGPIHLVPARALNLPVIHTDEGRVYAPDPMRSRERSVESDDDHDPLADERANVRRANLNTGQQSRLAIADLYTNRAGARREARPKGARISADEKAEAGAARRILIQLRREVLEQGESDSVRARIRNAEHLADHDGRAARRLAMTNRRARLHEAGLNRDARVRHLWDYRRFLRQAMTTRRNVDGLSLLALSPILESAAHWYRGLYERTERGPRIAQMGAVVVSESRDREASQWGADQITRKAVEAKVMAATPNGRGITALRLVAGEGRTINAISGGKSHNRKLNGEALMIALDVVADHRGMQ